jgi:pimeloyl-ACP methyl ester carboxylesterase
MEIGGVGIDVWRRGAGRPVLFLHPGDGFDECDPFLTALAAHYDVIAPWHPGFGHSDLPKGWNCVDDLAYFYLDFLDHLELEDTIVIGASFGGWIAAEMAVRQSPRLAKLALIDALGIRLGDRTTRDIADFHNTDAALLESLKWADPTGRQPDPSKLDDHALTGMIRSREAFAHFGWRPYMHNPGLARWLHRITVPTLALWGAEDGIVTPEYGRAYAELINGAVFETVSGAGHFPHIEQTDSSVQIIRKFIDG